MIQKVINPSGVLGTLLANLNNSQSSVFGCGMGEKLTIVKSSGKFVLFVCATQSQAYDVCDKLNDMGIRSATLCDDYMYDNSIIGIPVVLDTMSKLTDVALQKLDALVITPNILKLPVPTKEYLQSNFVSVKVGEQLDLDAFVANLISSGYTKCDVATDKYTFAVRGEIIDIVTPASQGYRIMLDYDNVESIRQYNVVTLLSSDSVDKLDICTSKFLDVPSDMDALIAWNIPYAKNELVDILTFVGDCLVVVDDTKLCWDNFTDYVDKHNEYIKECISSGKMTSKHRCLQTDKELSINSSAVAFQHISNDNKFFKPNKVFSIACQPTISYVGNWDILVHELKENSGATYLMYAKADASVNKLVQFLSTNGIGANVCKLDSQVVKGDVNVISKQYPVSANFAEEQLVIVGYPQLFTLTKPQTTSSNLSTYDGILPQSGDIVVHSTYGVGKCLGVQCLNLSTSNRDYCIVEYAGGDKLYVPVESIDTLSKYIGSDTPPKLNKLGSQEFAKTKSRVKGELKELAFSLVELYKQRMNAKGYTYPADDELQRKFEADFGYTLTDDQQNALYDIKADMQQGKVMDRLICGDVGFGKTEVALCTAFKTILSGKQVAFLCPTTILSEQHYNTAVVRMKKYGVNVQVLNRFKSAKECEKIISDVAQGNVDLIIGTHKLLNDKIKFKNLGLLILDEEQKFGVGDKEKIKNIKNNINVITLSATPIPRTLNMSLTGIRDISVIATPPVSRLATQVQVVEYSDSIVVGAVKRELARHGQVLVVYNKVESIYNYADKLKSLLPKDVVLDVAHGQMDKKQLEDAIFRLFSGDTQVLVATTLIENGVDLPNANTLVVVNADGLGLSQLYQLKGRIGRADKQSFAYFTFDKSKNLNENAYKRLQAITEFTAMGSGFKIAMRDLEIRGAGNVLGAEQSGHMQKVGYAMYVKLLTEAIGEIKGESTASVGDVRVECGVDAYIPTSYVPSYDLRLRLYGKISRIDSINALQSTLIEIENICGFVPDEVSNLCKIAIIKNYASHNGVKRVVLRNTECYIALADISALSNFASGLECFDFAEYQAGEMPIIRFVKDTPLPEMLDKVLSFMDYCQN